MAKDTMSQSQVANLVRAMQRENGVEPTAASDSIAASARSSPDVTPQKVDFRHRQRLDRDQLFAVESLHETIAEQASVAFTKLFRCSSSVRLRGVESVRYAEWTSGLDSPGCFAVLNSRSSASQWLLDVAPRLAFAAIDRLLGGDGESSTPIRRPLTDIETRVIGRWLYAFLNVASDHWDRLLPEPLGLTLDRFESDPQLPLIAAPNDDVVAIRFDVELGGRSDRFAVAIPATVVERLSTRLVSPDGSTSESTRQSRGLVANRVEVATVELMITLARSKIRTSELLDLEVGDLITTEQAVGEPLELAIQGIPKFRVRPGSYRGKKAVSVEGLIDRQ